MLKVYCQILAAFWLLYYCGKFVFLSIFNSILPGLNKFILDALPVSQINFNDEWNYRTETHIDPVLNSSRNKFLMPFYTFAKVRKKKNYLIDKDFKNIPKILLFFKLDTFY